MVQKNYIIPDGSKWDDEDIVISGISARLPNCDNVEEFQNKLLAKEDLITDEPRRFQNGLYGAIKRYGLLKDLSKFDAKFFNIHPKQADRMDPQIRNLLEVTYEATIDAGLNPQDLKGTKTGIVVGVASSETQDKWSQMPDKLNGYEYTGCTRTMFANRVSYFLDIKGPSYSIDTASSTTLVAFQQAYDMIMDGVCDACFVCGTDLVLNPCVCLMFQCLNMLSPEGKCKAFDIGGDGYVRSEGAVAVLLQKAKVAKRVYANVLAAGSNCDGYKDDGITFPSGAMQVKLFRRVADIAGIDPKTIDFMEAHGSATRVGDPQEMNAVTEVFTTGRKEPLRTGSIKSNMGHGEPASALSAVIKICVAMESGIIPPNLHYNTPNPDIPALLDGRLKVITEPTPWDGGVVAVNSFGVGGANGHALLLSNKKLKHILADCIPRLICVSGVTDSAVHTMLNKIHSLPRDPELYALLNNIHRKNINGHGYRGFMILTKNTIKVVQLIEKCNERTFCAVFPGLESSWMSVNTEMINIQVFQEMIKACELELKNFMKGVNLISLLTTLGKEKSPLNLIVGVTALQIGLIEVLRTVDLIPSNIIGCNIGGIAAAYAKDLCSLQQAMKAAYCIGNVLQRFYYPSSAIKINIPLTECNPPADVSVCCKISAQCTILSGPKQSISKFAQNVEQKGFKAEEVDSFVFDVIGILRSSNYVSKLKSELEKILSTTEQAGKCSPDSVADYLISSLTSTSSIQKAINGKADILTLHIGGNFGTDAPSKDAVTSISLFNNQADAPNLLSSIGQLYNFGFQPQLQNLYPKIEFPVSHGTPMIQSMIEWDHSEKWNVVSFAPEDGRTAGELEIVVDFNKEEFEFLPDNLICGEEVVPKAFYLFIVWKAMSRFQNKPMTEFPLVLENIFFIRETSIPDDGPVKFSVNLLETTGKFEISSSGSIVVAGHVRIPVDVSKEFVPASLLQCKPYNAMFEISRDTLYRCLDIKQYHYNDKFKQLQSFDFKNKCGKVKTSNWCSLMEAFIQISILYSVLAENSTSVVSFIRKVVINAQSTSQKEEVCTVQFNAKWNVFKSDKLQIQGVKLKTMPLVDTTLPRTDCSTFVSFTSENTMENAAEASLMFALENWTGCTELKVAELANHVTDSLLSIQLKNSNPLLNIDLTVYSSDLSCFDESSLNESIKYQCRDIEIEAVDSNCHIVIARNILSNKAAFGNLINSVRSDGCILLEETLDEEFSGNENMECISKLSSNDKTYFLLQKQHSKIRNAPRVITVSNLLDCAHKLNNIPEGSVLVVAKAADVSGLVQFMKSVMAETKNKNMRVMLLEDKNAAVFSLTGTTYEEQLKKNFPINVYKDGVWGAYLSLTLPHKLLVSTENSFLGIHFEADGGANADFIQANSDINKQATEPWNVCCKVCSASVNMVDLEVYRGKSATAFSLSSAAIQKFQLGMEFAGFEGKRKVFGLTSGGALATSVLTDKDLVWNIPQHWSFEEACTVPYSYALSYYGLNVRGNLQYGSSVLIIGVNGAALAAIYIAFSHSCNVFVLLSDKQQKPLLRKLFPQLKDSNLIVSTNDNFYLDILQNTAGKGVQLLFNTLPVQKYKFQSYICSLAEKGVCVYFNSDQYNEEVLGSAGNMRCITFHRVTPSCLFRNENVTLRKKINDLMTEGLKNGIIQPLPYTAFNYDEINAAFKFLCEEQIICKAIINIQPSVDSNTVPLNFPVEGRIYFNSKKSYIVSILDNNDFGMYVTAWMVAQGATNVTLICGDGEDQEKQNLLEANIKNMKLESYKITKISLNDFSLKNCESVIQKANQMGPVGGVFDFTQFQIPEPESLDEVNENSLKAVLDGKVNFLSNMDTATRKLCASTLDYFVAFSSVELQYGLPQYAIPSYANGVIQNLMRSRKNAGFNATLIQWGKVGESPSDVLYNSTSNMESKLPTQSVTSCLQTLHKLLRIHEPIVSSFIASKPAVVSATESKVDLIMEGVAKFLGIKNPNSVLPSLTMLELGLDSLIGTDIQQFLEVNYGVTMSTQEIRELNFEKLRQLAESL